MEIAFLVTFGAALVLVLAASKAGSSEAATGTLEGAIKFFAEKNGLTAATIKGIIRQESNWNAKAHGDRSLGGGAIGLMQIRQPALTDFNRANGTSYKLDDLFYPTINVQVGTWYLGTLAKKHGVTKAIEMYNVGESGYLRGVRNAKYTASVLSFSKNYA